MTRYGGVEPRGMAKTRQSSTVGAGAMACLRVWPVDQTRAIPPIEYIHMDHRFLSIKPERRPCCPYLAVEVVTPAMPVSVRNQGPRSTSTNPSSKICRGCLINYMLITG